MLNLLEVHAVLLVPDQNAHCVLIAFFVDLLMESSELLVQAILTPLVDTGSIEDVDSTFCFAEESRREGPFLLRLGPESQLRLRLILAREDDPLRVVVSLLSL